MAQVRPRWRVNEQSFVGHALVDAGVEVHYTPTLDKDGVTNGVGNNLSPLNDEAQAIVEEQVADHPDKAKHAAQRLVNEALAEANDGHEQENDDGPVKKHQAKGDTRTEGDADAEPVKAPPKGKKAKPATAGADDDDVG